MGDISINSEKMIDPNPILKELNRIYREVEQVFLGIDSLVQRKAMMKLWRGMMEMMEGEW